MEYRIKDLLKERGLNLSELSEKMRMKSANLSAALSEKGNPTIGTLEKIADALNVSIIELFEPESEFYGIIQYKGVTYKIDGLEAFKRLCMNVYGLDENSSKVSKE